MSGLVRALRRRRRADVGAGYDEVAMVCERLAALLVAGVPVSAVWAHVDDPGAADRAILAAAAAAAADGDPVDEVIGERAAATTAASAWSELAAALSVAAATGAPLAACLRDLAAALRAEAQVRRELSAALAGPTASARLVTALPVIAVVFGATFGFDTIGVLTTTPVGWACLAGGALLLWAGSRWNSRLLAKAQRPGTPGLELELTAIAMSSGASIERASEAVSVALGRHLPGARDGTAAETLTLAARAGAPVASLLRSEAARRRGAARADGAARAAALAVRLMIPLGICVLPSFVLLGVAPLMISVITATLGAG